MTNNKFKTLNEIKINNKNLVSKQKEWLDIEQTISEKFKNLIVDVFEKKNRWASAN
jgi:hypothetical protein